MECKRGIMTLVREIRLFMAYVDINGHSTWFEDRGGDGQPVLLLHGGASSSDIMLDLIAPALTGFRVLAFDRRGHGRTADSPGPMTYDLMAEETSGLLETLVPGQAAHLVGWSDGANTALLVALAHPELVASLILIGGNFHHSGIPEGFGGDPDGDSPVLAMMANSYGERSPDGIQHFGEVMAKTAVMWASGPTLTESDLGHIGQPALVLVGDDDVPTLAHTCAMYESLPAGQLAVVPGTSHALVMEKPAMVGSVIAGFLNDLTPPQTIMPMRRGR